VTISRRVHALWFRCCRADEVRLSAYQHFVRAPNRYDRELYVARHPIVSGDRGSPSAPHRANKRFKGHGLFSMETMAGA
jgi:hypothetical protein